MNKLKSGDMITDNGISYVIEMDEDGTLWGVSNNAEYEILRYLKIIFLMI